MPTQDISMSRARIELTTLVFCIILSDTDESSYCVRFSNHFKTITYPLPTPYIVTLTGYYNFSSPAQSLLHVGLDLHSFRSKYPL
jgi:hypothetical protein